MSRLESDSPATFTAIADEPRDKRLREVFFFVFFALLLAVPALAMILSLVDIKRDGIGPLDLLGGASAVAVSGDGQQVYVVGADDHGLTTFHRKSLLGTLTFLEDHEDEVDGVFGLLGASGVTISPDGRHVYVSARLDDSLGVFARDATNDTLTFLAAEAKANNVGGVIGLDGASAVAVSPDDAQVFVTADVDDALAVFTRDATTDELTFIEAELNGSGGVSGLDGAVAVALSPDNLHVYVAGEVDDSLVVFRRSAGGTVAFVARYQDGAGAIDGLDGAAGVAVSPDGRHVYVTGRIDNAVATFERDPATGELAFLELDRDGVDGVDGLFGAGGIAVSPDGGRVLVAGRYDNALAVFRRTPATGALEFLEALTDGVDGADGLGGALGLAVSPDGLHAYVASRDENALVGIRIGLCLGDDATGDADGDAVCGDLDDCLGDDFTADGDDDGVCDDLDLCPGHKDEDDSDGDGMPDGCDVCLGDDGVGDSDDDGYCDDLDLCPGHKDEDDSDGDGVPDGCDADP